MSTDWTMGIFRTPAKPILFTALALVETPCKPNADALHRVVRTIVRALFIVTNLITVVRTSSYVNSRG